MILGDGDRIDGKLATLDALFRRAGVRRPDALALADAPNRSDGAPRRLTYAAADRAISGVAARLRGLGLHTDSIVAIQLGNTVDSVIALLGVLRAGMIAVPLPLLWRHQDITDALSPLSPKAIITAGRIGSCEHVNVAMQVAAELFPVRFVCAFGTDLPDGIVPLDDVFDAAPADLADAARLEQPAAHVALVTFNTGPQGPVAVARSHGELIAGGLAVLLESGLPQDGVILSTLPVGSFGGASAVLLPWLLTGGTLRLHHGFDTNVFASQRREAADAAIVLPGPIVAALAQAGYLDEAAHILALWRAPERMAGAANWHGRAALTDLACFGETALVAATRGSDGRPLPIPLGAVRAPRDGERAMTTLETMRTRAGMLAVKGPMVPTAAFPPGIEKAGAAFFAPDDDGFVDTGFMCRLDRERPVLTVTGAAGGVATVGGYSIRPDDVEARLAKVDPGATLVAVPDALLGQRLAGKGRERTAGFLQAFGLNALVAGAFRKSGRADAA